MWIKATLVYKNDKFVIYWDVYNHSCIMYIGEPQEPWNMAYSLHLNQFIEQ